MTALADFYAAQFKLEFAENFHYRFALLLRLIGVSVEPVAYLMVWTTVARSQGGAIAGYTVGDLTAYFLVWILVRQMNSAMGAADFEELIKRGFLSHLLLWPIHPIHYWFASTLSFKASSFLFWIPVALILGVAFRPTLQPTLGQVIAFSFALLISFTLRFVLEWALGASAFWVSRVSAVFQVYFTAELLLSGRLVPLALLPDWAQQLASWTPFRWSFGFPLELLLGRLTTVEVLHGFIAQGLWLAAAIISAQLLWRAGLRRYSPVGI